MLICVWFWQGLYHGVPEIIIPMAFEQPWNAGQVEMLGAGAHVKCKYPIQRQDLAAQLAAALNKVLSYNALHKSAKDIAAKMKAQRWTPAERAASESRFPTQLLGFPLCITPCPHQPPSA